eukprot:m.46378 g.46378  ORF g.46378 m.46378 type:complete len:138 (+) comp11852_c0_seq2:225-638(+)
MADSERPEQGHGGKADTGPSPYDWRLFFQNARHFSIARTPCARDALLNGIAGGTGLGFARFFQSKLIGSSCNVAFVTFLTITLGSFELCNQRRRAKELEAIVLTRQLNEKTELMRARQKQRDNASTSTDTVDGKDPP